MLRRCQRVYSSLHNTNTKVGPTFGLRAQKTHLQFITQGGVLVCPVTTLLPVINRSITGSMNMTTGSPACSSVHPSASYMEIMNGWTAETSEGTTNKKVFQILRLVLRKLWLHPSNPGMSHSLATRFHTSSQFKKQKSKRRLTKKNFRKIQSEYCAQHTAKVPTLHRLCYSLLLLADCQSKMPLPSCSYHRLAAPNKMFLVIIFLLI